MKYTVYADGITEPNPGKSAWAFIAFDEDGNEVHREAEYMGDNFTNNAAEYRAIIEALVWCHEMDDDEILILTDSQLVVKQLNGEWQVKSDNVRGWYDNANDLFQRENTRIAWVQGVDNRADALTRIAYAEHTGLYPHPREKGQWKVKFTKYEGAGHTV